jgi:hypothetical protein
MNGEAHEGHAYAFEDGGNNACGCPVADGECRVLTTTLEPPTPLDPVY